MKSTTKSGRLAQIWKGLTVRQRRFVIEMQTSPSKKAAATSIGLSAQACYNWGPEIDEAVELYVDCAAEAAMAELSQAVGTAARKKVEEMDSLDPQIAARASSEVLDRVIGRPVARQEIEVDGRFDVSSDRLDEITDELARRAMDFRSDESSNEAGEDA